MNAYLRNGSRNIMELINISDLCKEYDAEFDNDPEISDNMFDESPSATAEFNLEEIMKTDPIHSMRQAKKLRQEEDLKTLKNWSNLPRQEITDDVKVFATRHAWDSKRFYKGDDRSKQTEYFQRGEIENSAFTPSTAVTKKSKHSDILDNLLESEALKKKLKKTEQKRQLERAQRVLAKRNIDRNKNKKAEKVNSARPPSRKQKLRAKKQNKAK